MTSDKQIDTPEKPEKKLWSIGRIICAILAIAGLTVTVMMAQTMLSHPFTGSKVFPMLIGVVSSAVFINMSIAIPQGYLLDSMRSRLLAGVGKWILTLMLPLYLMSFVSSMADDRTVIITQETLAPVINFIDGEFSRNGALPGTVLKAIKDVANLREITYLTGDDHYVLQTMGSSIDIDGSTLFYISYDKVWRRVHNDVLARADTEESRHYQEAVKDLTEQVYRRSYETDQWQLR